MKIFRVDADEIFSKAVWTLIVSILGFSAKKFNDMSNDIASLNRTMIEVVVGQRQDRRTIDDHELRIRLMENNPTRPKEH